MKTVAQILRSKPDQTVYTITPTASVFGAVKLMAEKSIGALVVMADEQVVGIITERDYARKIILMARSSKDTPVRDIMTSAVMYVVSSAKVKALAVSCFVFSTACGARRASIATDDARTSRFERRTQDEKT